MIMKKRLALKNFLAGIALIGVGVCTDCLAGQDVLIPSAAYSATQTTPNQYRTTETAAHVIIIVTAISGGESLTPTLWAKDTNLNQYTLLSGAAITSTGTTVLKIGRGIGQIPSAATADMLPDIYGVTITHSAGSATYSVTINRDP